MKVAEYVNTFLGEFPKDEQFLDCSYSYNINSINGEKKCWEYYHINKLTISQTKIILEIYRGNFIEAMQLLKASLKTKNASYELSILKVLLFQQHNPKLPHELLKLIETYIVRYLDLLNNKEYSWIFKNIMRIVKVKKKIVIILLQ
ncbi:MAG: hypothetical protein K2P93_06125 [Alphaproteobacteria bacterium]|nr:hypothetical protein [Alphaproteobacteria bacterium]